MKRITFSGDGRRSQRGVVLFVALIVLIVMTLAGLSLLRQMSVGTSIAGNIAFKESATYVADRGVEVAMQYINPPFPQPPTNTSVDSVPNGYASTWVDGDVATALPWSDNGLRSLQLADDPIIRDILQTNNQAEVFIQRMCRDANKSALDPTQLCSDFPRDNPFRSRGGLPSGAPLPSTTPFPFYRVTTRVTGPRNTVSYTEVLAQ